MTTATEAAAVAQKQFGLMQALEEGGAVSWFIFITMVIMSAVSWYIMFTKLIEQGKVRILHIMWFCATCNTRNYT